MPPDVQPEAGQGTDGGGLFDSYLQSVPDDARDTVASYLKDASKNVEAKLQEAAELRKTYEPYGQIAGLESYSAQDLSQLLAWHQQVTGSEDAFRQWLEHEAAQAGITPAEAEARAQGAEGADPAQIEKLIADAAQQQVAPVQEQLQRLEDEHNTNIEAQAIGQELDRLAAEHKLTLSDDQKTMILDLGMAHAVDAQGNDLPLGDVSWISKGLERFQQITSEGQRAFVAQKSQAPVSAMAGGGVELPKPATSFREAAEQARERLRQSQT